MMARAPRRSLVRVLSYVVAAALIVIVCVSAFKLLNVGPRTYRDMVATFSQESDETLANSTGDSKHSHTHGHSHDHLQLSDENLPSAFGDKHQHHDESQVAEDLASKVRVLCWVMTSPENHKSRAYHILTTWGRRCTKLLFVSEGKDGALPVVEVHVDHGREHLTAKTMGAFDHIYEHHLNDADWFMKADDDTYVIVENLRYFLSEQNPDDPVYFGHHFKVIVDPQGYFSGGAGYVLSREALRRFGSRKKHACSDDGGAEDVAMGTCMQKLGVRTGDSRDSLNRSRFHCFDPGTHLHGGYPDWYRQYDKYGAQQGANSISDYAISFHYVSVEHMYDLEFYIYHLRPFGIFDRAQNLNRKKTLPLPSPTRLPAFLSNKL